MKKNQITQLTAGDQFNFDFNGGSLRAILINGEPWFLAESVGSVLGIKNYWDSISNLDEDEKLKIRVLASGELEIVKRLKSNSCDKAPRKTKKHGIWVVSEPGVYQLIFQSKTPAGKRFKRFFAHEVLPAIRKTGVYVNQRAVEALLINLPSPWVNRFPDDFFNEVCRLWNFDGGPGNTPPCVGHIINRYIYKPLCDDLPKELKRKRDEYLADTTGPSKSIKLHQFLEDFAAEALKAHINQVLGLMRGCDHDAQFKHLFDNRFQKRGQMLLRIVDKNQPKLKVA